MPFTLNTVVLDCTECGESIVRTILNGSLIQCDDRDDDERLVFRFSPDQVYRGVMLVEDKYHVTPKSPGPEVYEASRAWFRNLFKDQHDC